MQQRTEALAAANDRLREASQTDPLTGLRNRRYMASQIPADLSYYDRQIRKGPDQGKVMVFALVDIDHFKAINDTFGHDAGDEVLSEFAVRLATNVRAVDLPCRYGGEEFVIVLPETPPDGALIFAERIREQIAEHPFVGVGGKPLQLTASLGVASFPSPGVNTVEELFARADEALYRSKAAGRNRVVMGLAS